MADWGEQGAYGPPGPPPQSFQMHRFDPSPSMHPNNYYGFNEPVNRAYRLPRGRRWASQGWGRGRSRGGGRSRRNGNRREGNRSPLKRDRSTMEEAEEDADSPNLSPAEKMMRTHSNFHRVKKIARNPFKKHRKATQDVKLPPGSVDTSLPTFEAQAMDLISKMELSEEQKRGVQQVLLDLTTVLRTLIEDIDPVVYGSMCTGLALGTSDIDCYMESKVVPDGAERMSILLKNRKALSQSKRFDCVIGIPKARVPILKATHIETGIEVDINCTTSSGISNSALIKYLVHSDDRIRQLVLLIQTFYRSCKISGTNKVTSYAVTLLVIYYLQRLPQPILPPLNKILFVGEGETWPASFERSIGKHVDVTQNQMTLTELFSGYFHFYATFDFTKVISLYLGCELESSCFTSDYDQLPVELAALKSFLQNTEIERHGFHEKHMMVQDPIEHHLNTTWNVPLSCFELFTSLNQTYCELLTKKPENIWLVNMMPGTGAAESNQAPAQVQPPPVRVPPPVFVVATQIKPQKFPPVMFNVAYPLEGCDTAWPEQLIPDFSAVFDFLLLKQSVKEEDAMSSGQNENKTSGPTIVFSLETHYNVFKTRFKNLHVEAVSDPSKFESIKNEITVIRDRMKQPDASFCATLTVSRADTPNELQIYVKDQNKNPQNVYAHFTRNLKDVLSDLLSSVRTLRSSTTV